MNIVQDLNYAEALLLKYSDGFISKLFIDLYPDLTLVCQMHVAKGNDGPVVAGRRIGIICPFV